MIYTVLYGFYSLSPRILGKSFRIKKRERKSRIYKIQKNKQVRENGRT
jgi:hypothetical protein